MPACDAAKEEDEVVKKPNPVDPDYEARVRSNFAKQGVMKTIGTKLAKVAPREVVIEFPYARALCGQL